MTSWYLKIAATSAFSSLLLAGCGAPPLPPEVEAEAVKPAVLPGQGDSGSKPAVLSGQGNSGRKPGRQKLGPLSKSYDAQLKGSNITVWRLPSGRILLEGSVPSAEQVKIAQQAAEDTYKENVINQLAVAKPGPPPPKPFRTVLVEEAEKGKVFHQAGWPIVVSPDGKTIATTSVNLDGVILHDIATRKTRLLRTDNVRDYYNVRLCFRSLAFTPDSKTIYTGGVRDNDSSVTKGTLNVWDVATAKHLKTFAKEKPRGPAMVLSPDNKVLVTGGIDNSLRFWNPKTGQEAGQLQGTGTPESMAYSPDGRYLAITATQNYDQKTRKWFAFRVWDLRTKKVAWQGESPVERFHSLSVAWSPNGKQIAVGALKGEAAVWDTGSRRLLHLLKQQPASDNPYANPKNTSSEVRFSPNSKLLATGGYEGVSLWNARTGKLIRHYEEGANGIAFTPDNSKLLMSTQKNHLVMEKL